MLLRPVVVVAALLAGRAAGSAAPPPAGAAPAKGGADAPPLRVDDGGIIEVHLDEGDSLVALASCVVGATGAAAGRRKLLATSPLLDLGGPRRPWWRRCLPGGWRSGRARYATLTASARLAAHVAPSAPGHGCAAVDARKAAVAVRAGALLCASAGATLEAGARGATTVAGGLAGVQGPGSVVARRVKPGERLEVAASRCVAWTAAAAGAEPAAPPAAASWFGRRPAPETGPRRTFAGPAVVYVATAAPARPPPRLPAAAAPREDTGLAAAARRGARRALLSLAAALALFLASLAWRPAKSLADAPGDLAAGFAAAAAAARALRRGYDVARRATTAAAEAVAAGDGADEAARGGGF